MRSGNAPLRDTVSWRQNQRAISWRQRIIARVSLRMIMAQYRVSINGGAWRVDAPSRKRQRRKTHGAAKRRKNNAHLHDNKRAAGAAISCV